MDDYVDDAGTFSHEIACKMYISLVEVIGKYLFCLTFKRILLCLISRFGAYDNKERLLSITAYQKRKMKTTHYEKWGINMTNRIKLKKPWQLKCKRHLLMRHEMDEATKEMKSVNSSLFFLWMELVLRFSYTTQHIVIVNLILLLIIIMRNNI